MLAPPKPFDKLPAGYKLVAGRGFSTVLPDMDFETYSEAGFVWNGSKWTGPRGSTTKKGLPAVGMRVYAEHPTCEVLSLAYDLKDGKGKRLWIPLLPPPQELFDYLATGGLIEAHNSAFEATIWEHICVKRMGWPPIQHWQYRCSAAKCRAFGLPGKLEKVGDVLDIVNKKHKDGTRLLNKFSIPRKPTKKNQSFRLRPEEDPIDGAKLYLYNSQDIVAEAEVSSKVPDLHLSEQLYWFADQAINRRGVAVDMDFVHGGIKIIEEAYVKYQRDLPALTGGAVTAGSEVKKITTWARDVCGYDFKSLDDDAVCEALEDDTISPVLRRVLEIRQLVGSASVKKLFALDRQISSEGRVHDLFMYHGARTGRASGSAVQPQNFPNSGPKVAKCDECGQFFRDNRHACPSCGCDRGLCSSSEWCVESMEQAIELINAGSLETIEDWFGDALKTVSGCLRGAFIPAEGKDLICSDYSAIEAVSAAELAGETWRKEAFQAKKDIYLMSISKMTGISYEEYVAYKEEQGSNHPDRKLGKIAELASGYQGWLGAWKAFGAEKFFDGEDEIKKNILAWRKASPAIVEMWGGQTRGWGRDRRPELYGLEGMAIAAVLNPGKEYEYRNIKYVVTGDVLHCTLLSGRKLAYHRPRVTPSARREGTLSLSYEGWNTNPKMGRTGWVRMDTYGGKLFENVNQAVARDIMTYATVKAESAGYPVVLHVHDELISEILEAFGSVEEFERIMSDMPPWAAGWPVRATGGWRGKRYRKD